ncbi:MAG: amidohydrolase [Elusimicrobia bacterium]|nr:amidohydrolase [Elusimicrobiota bacterium]
MRLAALVLALASAAQAAETRPEMILRGGKVFLGPGRYAEAVSVGGGRILKVGSLKDAAGWDASAARVVELAGRAVVPGFHDSHVHFMKGALSMGQANLDGVRSVEDVQERLRAYLKEHPGKDWVMGRGWDHTAFPGRRYPTNKDLDAVFPDRPVILMHVDEHLFWVNSKALALAGIGGGTPDPAHGQIHRDAAGEADGIIELHDSSMEAQRKVVPFPEPAKDELKAALRRALALAREHGVTSFQGLLDVQPEAQLEAWRELAKAGEMTARYAVWGPLEEPEPFAALKAKFADLPADRFQFLALKGFLDGVISARTAALFAPYTDDPKTKGDLLYTDAKLKALVERGRAMGFQLVLHAIGDRAVRQALDVCAGPKAGYPDGAAACRVDHIEVTREADIPAFAAGGVVASLQPSHITYDLESQNYNFDRVGTRIRWGFPWRSLGASGALVVFGTDWPVMPLDPRWGLFAATTRLHLDGKPAGGWVPEERLGLEETIVNYTLSPARAAGWAKDLGSIEPGKRADLVVFEKDLFAVSGKDLMSVKVDMTVFDGKAVYERALEP